MKYVYTGPFEAVDIPDLGVTVAKGETFDAPDGVILGGDFDVAGKSKAPATPAPTEES